MASSIAALAACPSNPSLSTPFKFNKTALAPKPLNSIHNLCFSLFNSVQLSTPTPSSSTLNRKRPYASRCCYSSYNFALQAGNLTKARNHKRYSDVFSSISYDSPVNSEYKEKKLAVMVTEADSEDALLAAANLRVRTFYEFNQSFAAEEHRRYRSQLEFQALKDRIEGKLLGFGRVTCVIATIPILESLDLQDDLGSLCKAIINGEERIVVGTLDLNQSSQLPDEISGTHPEGIEAQFFRAYLTNVCVAEELQRKGIGSALIMHAVKTAQQWGMTDLYVHVAVDNDAARFLYEKMGFIYESDEPAWRARFLGRPRRILLWANMSKFFLH